MATLKICVKKRRKDGFWPVYIRVTQHRELSYIKTDKMVSDKGVRKGEVTDLYVLGMLSPLVVEYMDRLNRMDIRTWTAKEVAEFLQNGDCDISFSDYARQYIDKMIWNGQKRNAKNYELALQHMERYAGTTKVMFSHLTSAFVNKWVESLSRTHRAKEMYPICMRQVFKAALLDFNDYDTGMIKIKTNPWPKVKIPRADRSEKLAITPEECRAFFAAPIPESKMRLPLSELGRDVAMMILCLAGINTIDLFSLKKKDCEGDIIRYRRAKTMKSRADGAYMEMRVPPILRPLMEKYKSEDDDPYLLNFHLRHTSTDSFGANVNRGIKDICESMGIRKEDAYCCYTFRHTWATIAQNDCGASIEEVAFGLNHSRGHNVTRGYIKLDFSPAWELNEKVVDLVFFTDKVSHREAEKDEAATFERFSPKYLMRGTIYFRGRELGKIEDIGYNNVDEMIGKLVAFVPEDVPQRSMVQIKIENVDKGQSVVYERMKGKGF